MKITSIQEKTVSIASAIRNAYIDFSKMTVSVLALETDVVRDGRRVVGYGFNSNGRYAQGGMLRERFIPRLKAAPATLSTTPGTIWIPAKIWDTVMANEKPGGHGDRSVAVGVIDMAVWDAVGQDRGQAALPPAGRALHETAVRRRLSSTRPAATTTRARTWTRCGEEMRGYLELGYTVVKMKIGAAPLADDLARIEAVRRRIVGAAPGQHLAVDANGRFDLPTRSGLRRGAAPSICSGTRSRATRSTTGSRPRSPAATPQPLATGENLFSDQDGANLLRYGGMRPATRLAADGPGAQLRAGGVPAHARGARGAGVVARGAASRTAGTSSRCTSRPAWGWAATSPTRACSSPSAALRTRPPCAQAGCGRASARGSGSRRRRR